MLEDIAPKMKTAHELWGRRGNQTPGFVDPVMRTHWRSIAHGELLKVGSPRKEASHRSLPQASIPVGLTSHTITQAAVCALVRA